MNELKWSDYFNIGVDNIDSAHRRLFSIMQKLFTLEEDTMRRPHACRETIKYFKSYTMKHFAEEEEYMRSINYSGYAMHKQLHDNLRDKTLPALEQELESQDYSNESVQHFLGICIGWLTGHIMIEDRAIVGRTANKWVYNPSEEELSALEKSISQVIQGIFRMEPQLVSENYGVETFNKGIFFRLTYSSETKQKVQVFLGFEERLILFTLSKILGKQLHMVDKTVVYAFSQLSKQIVDRVWIPFKDTGKYKLEKEDLMTYEQLVNTFTKEFPRYSLLFNPGGYGYFAFCVKQ